MSEMTQYQFPPLIQLELDNPDHAHRTHGKPGTYDAGCRGPFCAKAHRDKKRNAYRKKMAEAGRPVRPYQPRFGAMIDQLISDYYEQYQKMLAEQYLEGAAG